MLDTPGDPGHGRLILAAADCGSFTLPQARLIDFGWGSGLALASPFGTLQVLNISPDPDSGSSAGVRSTSQMRKSAPCGLMLIGLGRSIKGVERLHATLCHHLGPEPMTSATHMGCSKRIIIQLAE